VNLRAISTYEAATTANRGVVTIMVYPTIRRASEMTKALARPRVLDNELTKKAAARNPRALQRNTVETVL
jgi:hypothetical protein